MPRVLEPEQGWSRPKGTAQGLFPRNGYLSSYWLKFTPRCAFSFSDLRFFLTERRGSTPSALVTIPLSTSLLSLPFCQLSPPPKGNAVPGKAPCAVCKKVLLTGRGSRENPTCRDCRRKCRTSSCPQCGKQLESRSAFCSRRCSNQRGRKRLRFV